MAGMMWSIIIEKPTKGGLWAFRKVYTGSKISAFIPYLYYRSRYSSGCSMYQDPYWKECPGEAINEFRYKAIGSNEWTYEK